MREHWLTILVTVGIFAGLGLSIQQSQEAKDVSARLDRAIAVYNADRLKASAAQCERGDDVRAHLRLDASKNAKLPEERRAFADSAFPPHDCSPRSDGKFPELGAAATAAKLAAFEAKHELRP